MKQIDTGSEHRNCPRLVGHRSHGRHLVRTVVRALWQKSCHIISTENNMQALLRRVRQSEGQSVRFQFQCRSDRSQLHRH